MGTFCRYPVTMESAPPPEQRSGRLFGLLGLTYLTRLVGGALVTLPIAAALRATGVGHQPTGDGVLFAPGASYLFETARIGSVALGAALPVSCALFVVALLVQLVPQGILIHALARPHESVAMAAQRSWSTFSRFLLLAGLGFLAQACAAGLGLILAQGLRRALGGAQRAWSGEVAWLVVVALAALSVCTIGAIVDLARCAHVRGADSVRSVTLAACGNRALHTLLRHPWRCLTSVLVPTLAAMTFAVGVGFVTGALQVERGEQWRWLLVLVLHQLVVLACCTAELYWLSRATRLVRNTRRDDA
jgi:hypothetical protein